MFLLYNFHLLRPIDKSLFHKQPLISKKKHPFLHQKKKVQSFNGNPSHCWAVPHFLHSRTSLDPTWQQNSGGSPKKSGEEKWANQILVKIRRKTLAKM